MTKTTKVAVGDPLIRFSTVYEVFDIKEKKQRGSVRRVVFYKQLYAQHKNDTLICSIPEENLDKANIRQPLSEREIDKLLDNLTDPEVEQISFKRNPVAKRLNDNIAREIVGVIKNLWAEIQDNEKAPSKSKRTMLASACNRLAQEVAYVKDLSIGEAEELIEAQLSKAGEMVFVGGEPE